ncbi:MAG: protein kinase domain-containing protein [Rhabdochlamydiaceae bacterium]
MNEASFFKQNTQPGFSEASPTPPLPSHIGPYKIQGLLNKGGTSFLYLASHPQSNTPLAIKVMLPKYLSHPEMISLFMKEADIIRMTNHVNIVKLYGQGEWEGGLYIAMEMIQGVSLRQFIIQQSLSTKRSLEIILQVAYALLHLHTNGVIHRDLKPENILINEKGDIKVIDFGIAQLLGDDNKHSEHDSLSKLDHYQGILGTPNYMSPEQKDNPHAISFSSDIYALGVIAYELLIGKLSFGIINLSSLTDPLKTIIGKALAISPRDRYADIVDFIQDILNYLRIESHKKNTSGSEKLKEIVEMIQHAELDLSPLLLPDWPSLEIGLAKSKFIDSFGLYYDFFELPHRSYVICMLQSMSREIDSTVKTGVLKGMIYNYMHNRSTFAKENFDLLEMINVLNDQLTSFHKKTPFMMNFVSLTPWKNEISFVSSGSMGLLNWQAESQSANLLSLKNPCLGEFVEAQFLETTDNWHVGDQLILYSLDSLSQTQLSAQKKEEQKLVQMAKAKQNISCQKQAELILKNLSLSTQESSYSKAVIAIKRLN